MAVYLADWQPSCQSGKWCGVSELAKRNFESLEWEWNLREVLHRQRKKNKGIQMFRKPSMIHRVSLQLFMILIAKLMCLANSNRREDKLFELARKQLS
jgi:hypothetical protein